MAEPSTPRFVDLARNFVTGNGTGPVTLADPPTGYRSIGDALSVGDRFHYTLTNIDKPEQVETGIATLQADGVIDRTPGDGGSVSLSGGQKLLSLVAGASFFEDASHVISSLPVSPLSFGAVGDGQTDDSAAVQSAIDAQSAAYLAEGVPRVVMFPGGRIFSVASIRLKPGVDLIGMGGATLRKTPAGAVTDQNVLKWRTVLHANRYDFDSAAKVAHRIRIEGLILDGNRDEMNWTAGSYDQQQGHCLALAAEPVASEDRLRVTVSNCEFRNSVADGINVWKDVDLIARGVIATRCFRGGITLTGGNSRLDLTDYRGEGAKIDVEIDTAGFGEDWASDFSVENAVLDQRGEGAAGDLTGIDIGGSHGGNLRLSRVRSHSAGAYFANPDGGDFLVEDCLFTLGGRNGLVSRVGEPDGDMIFRRCEFRVVEENGASEYCAIHFYPAGATGSVVEFDDCRFNLDPAIKANMPTADCRMFWSEWVDASHDLTVRFDGGAQSGEWDIGFSIVAMARLDVADFHHSALHLVQPVNVVGYPCQYTLRGNHMLDDRVSLMFKDENYVHEPGAEVAFLNCHFSRQLDTGTDKTVLFDVVGHYSFPVTEMPSGIGACRGARAVHDHATYGASGVLGVTEWIASNHHWNNATWVAGASA